MKKKETYYWNDLFVVGKDKMCYTKENSHSHIPYNCGEKKVLLHTGNVPYLTFPDLCELNFIRHGFSTRLGGCSKEEYASMNLSYTRGDEADSVTENFLRMGKALTMDAMQMVFSDQVHDTKIHVVTQKDSGKGIRCPREITGIDGLITNEIGIPLVTFYADCVPLYFIDTKRKAIGLSHSGWKGTIHKMGKKTIEAMQEAYGTEPEDLICAIGPSICRDCYEVSEDVAFAVKEILTEEDYDQAVEEKGNGKYQLDLWLMNQKILMEAGVPKEQISISELCTCCNSKLLYSHRASGGRRGNLAAFLSLIS